MTLRTTTRATRPARTTKTARATGGAASARAAEARTSTARGAEAEEDAARFEQRKGAAQPPRAANGEGYRAVMLRAQQASPFSPRKTYDVAGRPFTGAQLERMRQDWLLLVLKRQSTSTGFRRKHGLAKPELNALKRLWPADFSWAARKVERHYPARLVEAATRIIESYHAEEMTYLELKRELKQLGVGEVDHGELEQQLPEGMRIARRSTAPYQAKRRAHFNSLADDVEELLRAHRWVVRKQTDLLDLLNASPEFKAKHPPATVDGRYNVAWLHKLRGQDRKEGDARIDRIFESVKTEGRRGRPQPNGYTAPVAKVEPRADAPPGATVREQLLALAQELKGRTPSLPELKKAIAVVEKRTGIKRQYRIWRLLMEKHKGVIPELQRWRVGAKNEITLRFLARWVLAMHEAGPGASIEAAQAVFARSREGKEDGRLPDVKLFSQVKQQTSLGWDLSPVNRARWQQMRALLEIIRTAPPTMDLKQAMAKSKLEPKPEYDKALYYLKQVLDGSLFPGQLDQRTIDAIKARPSRAFNGLGQQPDAKWDAKAEPPWLPLVLAEKLLSIPRVEDAPLFAHAIERLDGRLPLENSNVMVVFHRYADVATLLDLFARAGMSPKNAAFVSTPYPFDAAFDRTIEDLGVKQEVFPVYDLKGFSSAVERGIARMIAQHDDRKDKHGYGKPILMLDDGGQAAKLIETKFRAHAHKFKVVEVTAAGYRVAADLQEKNLRVPFVYYSVAYSEAKKKVASSFYAHRVVDRLRTFSDATGVQPPNKKVAVVGAGPMGRFAALYMQKLGYEVSIIEKSAEVRAAMIEAGIPRERVYSDAQMEQGLRGRGTVLAMTGFKDVVGMEHKDAFMDGAVVAQGASKRNDFDMAAFEGAAKKKTAIPRSDGVPQPSYTYAFEDGKQLHFVGDGWTVNHDGSLHGSPFKDVQLETSLLFESVVEAAGDRTTKTGELKVVGAELQEEYLALWREHYGDEASPRG